MMKPEVDIVPAQLEKRVVQGELYAAIDLTELSNDELHWILTKKVISIPVLVRNIIALKQNHVSKVLLQYGPSQTFVRDQLEYHPVIGDVVSFYEKKQGEGTNRQLLEAMAHAGSYWVKPNFIINGIFLDAFEEVKGDKTVPASHIVRSAVAQDNIVWLSKTYLTDLLTSNGNSLNQHLKVDPKQDVSFDNPEVYGREVHNKKDVKKTEKMLFEDVTRKKGGYLAKIINEPISLWIAKYCAKTPVTPNFITLLNTILGVLSAYWVYVGGREGSYAYLVAGAILFYLVDIFDGIDGELARFTFRLSKHGALYDTISDNITLISFLAASTYAAYMQVGHWWVVGVGVAGILLGVVSIFYLLYFTTKHFGNASLRLYEARFLQRLPKSDGMIRLIEKIKHLYTKDILCALISLALIINLPVLIPLGTAFLMVVQFIGFFYMGLRYGHMAGNKVSNS